MKARGGRFLLVLGAALAAMAFVVVYVVMSGRLSLGNVAAQKVPDAPVMTTVAVVSRDVPAYTVLDASNVTVKDVEATTALAETTEDPSVLYGKMTLLPLTKDQQIQKNTLTTSGFSNVLAKGEKAFTLAVPERNTFGNSITENDRVDIIYTVTLDTFREVPPVEGKPAYEPMLYTTTKTLLQNVRVLRVLRLQVAPPSEEQRGSGEPVVSEDVATTGKGDVSNASMYVSEAPYQSVLLLAVTDQQAEVLVYARETGLLDFTLRSSAVQRDAQGQVVVDGAGQEVRGDQEVEKTTGISIDKLIEQYGIIPAPAPQLP